MSVPCVVVMPVYNEEQCIRAVCEEWLQLAGEAGCVVAVDDGSRDATAAILAELARANPRLRVVRQENQGHGAAVLRGYAEALALRLEWIFQVDSDGQFVAEDFWRLWEARGRSAFLLGCRAARQDHPLRIFLSKVHRGVLRALFGARIADPNIPFRLMRADLLERLLGRVPAGTFAPNVLLALLAARAGEAPGNIPVRHRARVSGAPSIRGWKTIRVGLRCARELIAFRVRLLRRGEITREN